MGLDYCVEENMDDDQAAEEMDVQEYLECRELGLEDYYGVYDDNGDAVQLFAGPKCASCLARNDDDDDAGDAELSQMCEEIYETTAKCETNLNIDYKNELACNFISSLGQKDDNYVYSKSSAAPAFAWIFAFSTIGLAAYVYTLHNKREIQLADSNGQLA